MTKIKCCLQTKWIVLLTFCLMSTTQASYRIGKCPKVIGDWTHHHQNQPLNHTGLLGEWQNIYDGYHTQIYTDCQSLKIQQVNVTNSTMLQFMFASSLPMPDQDVFIDDKMVATFNHPNDTSLAAISHLVDGHEEEDDIDYLAHYDTLILKPLEEDIKDLMDQEDIEHYEFQREEQLKMRSQIESNIHHGNNKYLHPTQVLDTDYETFLILYSCREEQRVPQDHDDTDEFVESFRAHHEEHIPLPPRRFANDAIEKHAHDKRFLNFQKRLRDDANLTDMNDQNFQDEIDEFLLIDPSHVYHFKDNKPNLEQWRVNRMLYARALSKEEIEMQDREIDRTKNHTFNSMSVQIYLRNAYNLSEDAQQVYIEKLQEIIPGHKFDDTHEPILHTPQHCVNGSMFDHPHTKNYEQLIGLESDKRLLEEQRHGEGIETDYENLDEFDENELDDDTEHLLHQKDSDFDDVDDHESIDGVGLGDDWDNEDAEDEDMKDQDESEHEEL